MISVICSVYNAEKYLQEYLKYVNLQFLKEFEIIFIDAKSTDQSLEIIRNFKFRSGIQALILPQQNNINIYEAWNIGIKEANGDYIVNWNTDDILFPSALKTYDDYSQAHPDIDLFYGPCFLSREHSLNNISNIYMWPEYSHQQLLARCICGPFPMVKKSAIKEVNFFNEDYISSGDYDMWLKLSYFNYKFKKIPEVVGCFLGREDSVSQSKLLTARQEDLEIQKKYVKTV